MTAAASMGGAQRAVRVERPAVALLVPGEPRTASVGDGISLGAGVDVPQLHRMSPRARTIALEYYAYGFTHGVAAGRRGLEEEWTGRQEVSAAIARRMAASGPFDALCAARGEPERAARHRALMAERGIFPC